MITGIEPRRIRMEFTYEADPLLTVTYEGLNYLLQRLIVAIEPNDEPGDAHHLYIDIDCWGRRLTKSGRPDQRTGFDRIYISPLQVQTFMDDAERRYRQLVVRP